MISVQITKLNTDFIGIQISGHSLRKNHLVGRLLKKIRKKYKIVKSEKNEEVIGENVICAAVSILVQSLFLFCKKNNLVDSEKITEGFLKFNLKNFGIESNSAFEMVELGLKNLQEQYPKEIEMIYIKG